MICQLCHLVLSEEQCANSSDSKAPIRNSFFLSDPDLFLFSFSGSSSHRCRGCTGARLRDGNLSFHNTSCPTQNSPRKKSPTTPI